MNKKLHYIFLVCLLFASGLIMSGCSNKDKDDEPEDRSQIVGTWYANDYDHFYSNITITFNNDGTGSATIEHHGSYTSIYRAQFTYKVKGIKVTTTGTIANANSNGDVSTQDFNNTYEIQGRWIYVKGGNSWYTNIVKSYQNWPYDK